MSDKIKAQAIKDFVNSLIGAHESGFVDSNTLTLATLHRVAQNHIKDEYGINTPSLVEQWGEESAADCGFKK